jgi:hypothetical protein
LLRILVALVNMISLANIFLVLWANKLTKRYTRIQHKIVPKHTFFLKIRDIFKDHPQLPHSLHMLNQKIPEYRSSIQVN